MSPGDKNKIDKTAGLLLYLAFITMPLLLSGCAVLSGGIPVNNREAGIGGGVLKGLRPAADPALVERIKENELREAQKKAAQDAMVTQTAGAEVIDPALGRNLPKVSTDPISGPANTTAQNITNNVGFTAASQDQNNNAFANQNNQLSMYENAYNSVPPPPPGSLANGFVPPPPAVTLSTQAQTYPTSNADFYNNPYFNPYGVPAPPQATAQFAAPEKRPAGLFGDGNTHGQPEYNSEKAAPKHRTDFVPITPTGMEARSPYKQRDDLRILWRAAIKDASDSNVFAENKHLLESLGKIDVNLPADSSRGSFNVSSRQTESLFRSSAIDRRYFADVRKLQTDLVQSYYRYLCAYNKYALAEQTTAARQQEVDLSDSDLERQKGTADLAQAKNDLDSTKDDMHSAEMELAAASSPTAARSIISRVAGVAPSVESLAQGCSQINNRLNSGHMNRIANVFESVFRHHHDADVSSSDETSNDNLNNNKALPKKHATIANDTDSNGKAKRIATSKRDDEETWVSRLFSNKSSKTSSHNKVNSEKISQSKSNDEDLDLSPAPPPKKTESAASEDSDSPQIVGKPTPVSSSTISFELKGINIKPRKSVLTVAVKNSSDEAYELNPDAISISEGNHKLASADMRTDFDMTSIQPDHEVKGTITVFGHPWNDRLLVYLNDGNKKIQLKR